MKQTTVRVRVLRALLLHGDHISAGRQVEVTALDAHLLLESTRAELVDKADMTIVRDAVHAQTAVLLLREGGKHLGRIGG